MSIHMNKNNRHHYLDNIDYRCSRRSLLYQSLRHDLVQTWAICLMQTSLSFNAFCAIWTQRQLPILFDPMMPNAPSSHYLREVALQVSLDLLDTLHDVERETVLKILWSRVFHVLYRIIPSLKIHYHYSIQLYYIVYK